MAGGSRRKARWAGAILGLAALGSADAGWSEELRLGFESALTYDDRVFGDEGDFALRLEPRFALRDPKGRLQWELDYRPFYEAFLDFSDASGLSHVAHAEGTWQIDRRTTLEVSDRFRDLSRERLFNEVVLAEGGETILEERADADRVTRNDFDAELRHLFSPVDSFVLSVRHDLLDQEDETFVGADEDFNANPRGANDRTSFGLTAQYLRSVSARTTLGLSLSATRSETTRGNRDEGETDFFNLSGSWSYQPEESFEMRLSAGPTLIDSEQPDRDLRPVETQRFPSIADREALDVRTCPTTDAGRPFLSSECEGLGVFLTPFGASLQTTAPPIGEIPSDSDTALSFFANGSITKRWGAWSASLRYRRRESTGGGLGSSTISDVVTGGLRWEPKGRWRAVLRAQWARRTQATESAVPVLVLQPNSLGGDPNLAEVAGVSATTIDRDFESSGLTVALRGRYELTRRMGLFSRAAYTLQRSDFATEDVDAVRLTIGVDYHLDPIRF